MEACGSTGGEPQTGGSPVASTAKVERVGRGETAMSSALGRERPSSSQRVTINWQGSAEHSASCPQPTKSSWSWSWCSDSAQAQGCNSHPLVQRAGTATSAQQLRMHPVQRNCSMRLSLCPAPTWVNEKPTGCDAVTRVSAKRGGNCVQAAHNQVRGWNSGPVKFRRRADGRTGGGRGPSSLPARRRRRG